MPPPARAALSITVTPLIDASPLTRSRPPPEPMATEGLVPVALTELFSIVPPTIVSEPLRL